jgi:hypothetical protein
MSPRTSLIGRRARTVLFALVGVALSWWGASLVHVEMHRAEPSTTRIVLFVCLALLGLITIPGVGAWVRTTATKGITVAAYGRRAYDGKCEPSAPKDGTR